MTAHEVIWILIGASGVLAFDRFIERRFFFATLYVALCGYAVFIATSAPT